MVVVGALPGRGARMRIGGFDLEKLGRPLPRHVIHHPFISLCAPRPLELRSLDHQASAGDPSAVSNFSGRNLKQFGLHVNLAQLRQTAAQLQERLHSVEDAHVGEANFFDELELRVL